MSYQILPEPRPRPIHRSRIYNHALERDLKDIFSICKYKSSDPVLVINFASDNSAFEEFIEGKNLKQINEAFGEVVDVEITQWQLEEYGTNPCVVMCDDKSALVLLEAVYGKSLHTQYLFNCISVKRIRIFNSAETPAYIQKVTFNKQFPFFRLGSILSPREKEHIYSVCHNIYFVDDRLYLSADVNRNEYSALAVANYLTNVACFLDSIGCTRHSTVYTKIDIHSPGNILLYVENAVAFCTDNWMGLLLLFTALFGGKLQTDKFTVELPSFRNLVEYFANREYEKKMREESLKQAVAKTKAMELDNKSKRLELRMRTKQLISNAKAVEEASRQLKVTAAKGNSTDPEKVLEVVDHHTA